MVRLTVSKSISIGISKNWFTVNRSSNSQLAMTLVDLYFHYSFIFFFVWHKGQRSGARLANTLVDCYFHHFFYFLVSFFSPSSTFLIEGVLGLKNLLSKSWRERPKNLAVDHFPDLSAILRHPGGHFGFLRCHRIKKLI